MQNSVLHHRCDTCAAAGRSLQAIRSMPNYFDACKNLPVTKNDMICFECRATLRRIVKFKLRALRVKTMLKHASYNISKIQCLSTLIQTDLSPKDILYVGGDYLCSDIDSDGDLVKVKQENLGSGDEAETVDDVTTMACLDETTVRFVEWMPESQEFIECVTENEQQIFLTDTEVPDVQMEVKVDTEDSDIVVTTETQSEPSLVPQDDKLKECKVTNNDSNTESKSKWIDNDDDSETDTASEAETYAQTEPIYTVKRVDTAEVLSYMEKLRGTLQYRCARFKCESCALVLHTEQWLQRHKVLHSETRGSYKCLICKQRFQTASERLAHTTSHYSRYDCRHCDKVGYSHRQIYQHFVRHHDNSPRFCNVCNARFTRLVDLKRHKRTAHPAASHACDACDRRYATPMLLLRHKRMAHMKVQRVECEICHKWYKGDFNLDKHMREVHVKPTVQEPDENAYCAECDKQFSGVHLYRAHLKKSRSHVGRSDVHYECHDCGKTYQIKSSLAYHIESMHLRLSRYKCDLCDQSFINRNLRNTHRRRQHRLRKTYTCTVCGKNFKVHMSLKEHMNTHLGVRPYVCAVCGDTFPYKASLYTHNQLVHLKGSRPSGKRKR